MQVLLTGATGFIGRHVCARLLSRGHSVTAAVRDPASALRRFPGVRAVRADMNRMDSPSDWAPLIQGVDAVVNCAGVLRSGRGQSLASVHDAAPRALFDACLAGGVRRVIQISAVSADAEAGTEFALTKKAADDHLRSLDLEWTVLRPSLVYGSGSFGGTSVIRGLAGLPLVLPVIGDGSDAFQPIHVEDLAETVLRCLDYPALRRRTLEPCGPETLTAEEIALRTRAWLDLPAAPVLRVPRRLVRLLARAGDVLGAGPVSTAALDMMEYGNVADPESFRKAAGFSPRSMDKAFLQAPSHVQDRWHARLFFLRPALALALAALWIGSGLAGLLNPPADAVAIASSLGFPSFLAPLAGPAFSCLDLAIGAAIACGRAGRGTGLLQLAVVGGYTLAIGAVAPELWADPYGALLKNLPILGAIAAWTAMQDEK